MNHHLFDKATAVSSEPRGLGKRSLPDWQPKGESSRRRPRAPLAI